MEHVVTGSHAIWHSKKSFRQAQLLPCRSAWGLPLYSQRGAVRGEPQGQGHVWDCSSVVCGLPTKLDRFGATHNCVSCNGACCHSESFTQPMSGIGAHLFPGGKASAPSLSSPNADLGAACSGMVMWMELGQQGPNCSSSLSTGHGWRQPGGLCPAWSSNRDVLSLFYLSYLTKVRILHPGLSASLGFPLDCTAYL